MHRLKNERARTTTLAQPAAPIVSIEPFVSTTSVGLVPDAQSLHNTAMQTLCSSRTHISRRVGGDRFKGTGHSIIALSVVLAVLLFGGGCSGGEEATVDPTAVFAESVTAMKALQSFHFVYDVENPSDAPQASGTAIVRIVGDVAANGNMQASIDLTQNGVPLKVEFVAVGPTHYVQDPTSQKWQGVPAAFSPVGALNLSAGTIQVLERITGLEYVGEEDVGGGPAYRIKGQVEAADVAAIAGSTSTETPFEGEVWIGVGDHLVKRINLLGAATANETTGTVRTIELSDFDKPVEIVPPQ